MKNKEGKTSLDLATGANNNLVMDFLKNYCKEEIKMMYCVGMDVSRNHIRSQGFLTESV